MYYLRKTYVLLSFLFMSLLVFCYCTPFSFSNDDDEKAKEIIKNVRRSLGILHYSAPKIDDDFSAKVYKTYMQSLDPNKTFFKASDMKFFNQFEDKLDEAFEKEDITLYKATVDTLYKRWDELNALTKEILKSDLNFNENDSVILDFDEATYPATDQGWAKRWEKRLKVSVLQEIILLQESAKDSALWARRDSVGFGEDEFDPRNKSLATLETEAKKQVEEMTSEMFRRNMVKNKFDYFSFFMNAFTTTFDPHTNFFSPKQNEDFELMMSGQLEGIGATLTDEKGYPTIRSLVVGGPAWKQGELEVEDKITKVIELNKEPVNVVGMALEDAIRHIRGKKGTKVTLVVKKKDGSFKNITIERDVVELEETFAKSSILQTKEGRQYGIINLPSFYLNFDGKGHDASDDVKRQIEALKESNVEGIIFDLRGNGGGDLEETVEIVGHFIPSGPVVQAVRSDGDKKVFADKDKSISWSGPLVVLVNELSASASEIMAAALQDYGRAIIIGSPQTYGKGTVQIMRPLNWFSGGSEDLGRLKFTYQKFYRINGGSTQLRGVSSDIVIPDRYKYIDITESSNESALPWDQISAQTFTPWKEKQKLKKLISNYRVDKITDKNFKSLDEYARWMKQISDDHMIYLNINKFKADYEQREKMGKKFDTLSKYKNGFNFKPVNYEIPLIEKDTVLAERRKKWQEAMGKDIYLQEAVRVLKDWNK